MSRADYRKQKQLDEARKLRIDNAVRAMVQHPDTRDYLRWLLEIGRVGEQPFAGNDSATNFRCGELNVGQQIFAHLTEVSPDGYIVMMQEMKNERDAIDARNRSARRADDDESDAGAPVDDPSLDL